MWLHEAHSNPTHEDCWAWVSYSSAHELEKMAKSLKIHYGRPLSVSGRPCYILPMFFYIFFYGRLILRPWLTEVLESFTRGGP